MVTNINSYHTLIMAKTAIDSTTSVTYCFARLFGARLGGGGIAGSNASTRVAAAPGGLIAIR